MKKTLLLSVITICFCSCFHNYYKVKTITEWPEDKFKNFQADFYKVIVHFTNATMELSNAVYNEFSISGSIIDHQTKVPKIDENKISKNANFRYKYKYRDELLSELHLYVNERFSNQSHYEITRENFVKLRTNKPNVGLSIASHVLGVVSIVSIVCAITVPVVAATSMAKAVGSIYTLIPYNCPQAFIETSPGQYQFIAGLFTGAKSQALQRSDFVQLPASNEQFENINVRINGYPGEMQYIDQVGIKQVIHPTGTKVVTGIDGSMFITDSIMTAFYVQHGDWEDRSKALSYSDNQNFGFHIADSNSITSHIVVGFQRNSTYDSALLVLRLKNSVWSAYIRGQLNSSSTQVFLSDSSPSSFYNMSALRVFMKTTAGWTFQGIIYPVGNTSYRELALKLDLKKVQGSKIEFKIESPYRFWDIDMAGICFGISKATQVKDLQVKVAQKNNDEAKLPVCQQDYRYITLSATDTLDLQFEKPTTSAGMSNTYMLHANGYYENSTPEARLNIPFHFPDPSELHQFSIKKYQQLELSYAKKFQIR